MDVTPTNETIRTTPDPHASQRVGADGKPDPEGNYVKLANGDTAYLPLRNDQHPVVKEVLGGPVTYTEVVPGIGTVTTQRLWISNGGRIACDDHLGGYGTQQLAADPEAEVLITPLDLWETADELDRQEWQALFGWPLSCDTCRASHTEVSA